MPPTQRAKVCQHPVSGSISWIKFASSSSVSLMTADLIETPSSQARLEVPLESLKSNNWNQAWVVYSDYAVVTLQPRFGWKVIKVVEPQPFVNICCLISMPIFMITYCKHHISNLFSHVHNVFPLLNIKKQVFM